MWHLEDARELLHAGIRANQPHKTRVALSVFSEVKTEALEKGLPKIVKDIHKALFDALGNLAVIRKVVSKSVSEDILEQMLDHVDIGIFDLWGLKPEAMTIRTSNLLAGSLIRTYDKGYYDYQKILEPFAHKKFHAAWKMIYGQMLRACAEKDIAGYRIEHLHGDSFLFDIVHKHPETPLTAPILEVLMENQAAVLKHLDKLSSFKDHWCSKRPLPAWAVIKLHALGFTEIFDVAGVEVFAKVTDPRQLILAKEAGISITKEFVTSKLLATAYEPMEATCQRMSSDAIVYALESDDYSLADFKALRARVTGDKSKTNADIKHMLRTDVAEALHGVYGQARTDISQLMIDKTRLLINWALKYEPNGLNDDLMSALTGLKHLPKTLIHRTPRLRDIAFGADLGL